MSHPVTFTTRISINTTTDSIEVFYDACIIIIAIILSLAMLVYIDNDRLNIYNRLLE